MKALLPLVLLRINSAYNAYLAEVILRINAWFGLLLSRFFFLKAVVSSLLSQLLHK